jgi:hypothetical protein
MPTISSTSASITLIVLSRFRVRLFPAYKGYPIQSNAGQVTIEGKFIVPTPSVVKNLLRRRNELARHWNRLL